MARRGTEELADLGLAALGGVAGVFVNQWLAKIGIKLPAAAAGTTVVATVLAALLGGRAALVAGGAAAGSVGQLSLVWMEALAANKDTAEADASGTEG